MKFGGGGATAHRQGIWFYFFPAREKTGKMFETQGKYFWQHNNVESIFCIFQNFMPHFAWYTFDL